MFEIFQLPFMQRALMAIILMAFSVSALGIFVILRKMSFFADAIAHASLFGIALGIVLGWNPFWGALLVALAIAIGIARASKNGKQSLDAMIGIFYAAALSLGVIMLSRTSGINVNLSRYLFGDILAIDGHHLVLLAAVTLAALTGVAFFGKRFLLLAIDPETGTATHRLNGREEYFFLILLALMVTVSIKIAGIILVGPLLVIPAACAKNLARSLRGALALTFLFSFFAGVLGLMISFAFNFPSGPTIVALSALMFFATLSTARK